VEAGEKLGYLPGDLSQKVDPYLRPLYDALYEMLGFETVNKYIERSIIEVAPLAFMRGRTLNHAFIILDEAQNTTREQMKMFLTRIGFGSTAVITGDATQIDLPRGAPVRTHARGQDPRGSPGHRLHLVCQQGRGASPTGAAHRRRLRRPGRQGREHRCEPVDKGLRWCRQGADIVTLTVDVQNDSAEPCPDERVLREAVAAALRGAGRTPRAETEVSLRIVDAAEMRGAEPALPRQGRPHQRTVLSRGPPARGSPGTPG
jgi:hypothetical protein